MRHVQIFEVGGCVRDSLLGLQSKDIDFSVVVTDNTVPAGWDLHIDEAYAEMRNWLIGEGFEIFLETPEYLTIRARFPRGGFTLFNASIEQHDHLKGQTADFVLARRDGPYSDGRRPDFVVPGTLADDLARRDFTVNAIARTLKGEIIDPFNGRTDLEHGFLRCVGSTKERFTEDALRVLRALRFHITKGFNLSPDIMAVFYDEDEMVDLVAKVSVDRRRVELDKAFHHDTFATMEFLQHNCSPDMVEAMFSGGIRLTPTLRK